MTSRSQAVQKDSLTLAMRTMASTCAVVVTEMTTTTNGVDAPQKLEDLSSA
jgi:hypothetical protein